MSPRWQNTSCPMAIDLIKDAYQKEVCLEFFRAGYMGTYEAAPGIGKSRVTALILGVLFKKKPYAKACIVVPGHALKAQWE